MPAFYFGPKTLDELADFLVGRVLSLFGISQQLFPPWEVALSTAENEKFTSRVADELDIYKQGFVHPHLLLSLANSALMQQYFMPAWLHVGSEIRHRASLRTGDDITIRCATLDKWQKKGHEFIRLYVGYWRGETLTTDCLHTAIFKIAA